MRKLVLFAMVGVLAPLIDGALGMAGRAEDGELHVGAGPSNAGTPVAIGSIAAP